MKKFMLFFNTIKYLKPVQIFYQVLYRCSKTRGFNNLKWTYSKLNNYDMYIEFLDADNDYVSRFCPKDILNGKLTLLNDTVDFQEIKWHYLDQTNLWNFNLHYLEYCIPLAVEYKRTGDISYYNKLKEIILSWLEFGKIEKFANHPYTISLRIINLMIVCSIVKELEEEELKTKIYKSIYVQYKFLIKNKEKNLLGNHYFENLKTILICSIVFGEDKIYSKTVKEFLKQIEEQILPSGLHYERSLMYHKIILEDVLRVAYLLKQAKKEELKLLLPIIRRMTIAMNSLEKGLGKTPFFNDSADGVSKDKGSLTKSAFQVIGFSYKESDFENSVDGYFKLYDEDYALALILDASPIGPTYMAGHGHCDCLSFEVSYKGKPLFVNSGTFQYQSDRRKYFRSTPAHNTLTINDHEQSECWGEHRVARRIKRIFAQEKGTSVIGEYTNFLGERHRRRISCVSGKIEVFDQVYTNRPAKVKSFLHVAPTFKVVKEGFYYVLFDDFGDFVCRIIPSQCNVVLHTDDELAFYSSEFGKLQKGTCFEFCWNTTETEHKYDLIFYNKEK